MDAVKSIFVTLLQLSCWTNLVVIADLLNVACDSKLLWPLKQGTTYDISLLQQLQHGQRCNRGFDVIAGTAASVSCRNFNIGRSELYVEDSFNEVVTAYTGKDLSNESTVVTFPVRSRDYFLYVDILMAEEEVQLDCILVGGSSERFQEADELPANSTDCGRKKGRSNKIVGGTDAAPHEFPWQVALLRANERTLSCGGTVIGDRWVLTAGHCCIDKKAKDIVVVLGEHILSIDDDADKVFGVNSITIHPNYTTDNQIPAFDVALLKLDKVIKEWSDVVRPACLPSADSDYAGVSATVTGWGTMAYNEDDYPDVLQKVENLLVLGKEKCGVYSEWDPESQLCAEASGKDSCTGDSGGPLVTLENGRYTLIGVVSWGSGCAEANHPGVYARVTAVMDWIEEVTSSSATNFGMSSVMIVLLLPSLF